MKCSASPLATLLILVSLALAPSPVMGQATSTEPGASEARSLPPITLQELPRQAAEVIDHIREIQRELDASRQLSTIERGLGGLVFDIGEDEIALAEAELESLSIEAVQRLLTSWEAHNAKATGWLAQLDAEWQTWIARSERVAEELQRWERADSLLTEEEELSISLRERTSEVLSAGQNLEREIEKRIERLLNLIDQVTEQDRRIGVAIAQIEEVEKQAFARLGRADSVPLWQVSRSMEQYHGLFPLLRDSISDKLAEALDYLGLRPARVTSHVISFVLLLTSFILLRRRSRAWSAKDDVLRLSGHVLSRPLASSLVLALTATRHFYSGAPPSVVGLALLISILPVWRLLPDLVSKALRPVSLVFLLLFSVNTARNLTFNQEGLRRFALLVVTLCAWGLAAWCLARLRGQSESTKALPPAFLILVIATFAAVMIAATLANILGWVRLAEFLTQGSFLSVFIGMIILVAYFICSGLIRAFPDTPTGQRLRSFSNYQGLVVSRSLGLLGLLAFVMWIKGTLQRFHLGGFLNARFNRFLDSELTLGAIEVSVGRVFSALTILLVGYLIARLIRFLLAEEILCRFDIRLGVAHAVATMVYYIIFAVGSIGAASALGLGTQNLALMASALGVGIGFGLQTVVGNFVSGLILIFERPVKVGDLVEVGSILGTVGRIGIRASTIRTFDGAEVVVPNSHLVSKEVTNWTLSDLKRRRDFEVCVSWGTDPDTVIELLQKTVNRNETVLPEPTPFVFFRGYDGGDLRFSIFFWTSIEQSLGTLSNVGLEINRALVAAGIEVALPNRDVRIRGSLTTKRESDPPPKPSEDPTES